MNDDILRVRSSGDPFSRQRAVAELIVRPQRGNDETWNRRIGTNEVLAIPSIQLLEKVDLACGKALLELLVTLGQRLNSERLLAGERCRLEPTQSSEISAAEPSFNGEPA